MSGWTSFYGGLQGRLHSFDKFYLMLKIPDFASGRKISERH